MAAASDTLQKQLAVIEFLVCENETVGNILKRMQEVYVEDTVDHSTVRQLAQRSSGKGRHTNIGDCRAAAATAAADKIWLHNSEPEWSEITRILKERRNSKLGFRQEISWRQFSGFR
jgi:hypothetical protein